MKIKLIDYGVKAGQIPVRKHYNDAGADVYAGMNYVIPRNSSVKVPLGFGVEIPDGCTGFIFPRSGLCSKGLTCELPPIDSGYRGEIHAVMTNCTENAIPIKAGDRIGQLVILPVVLADFVWALGDERGTGAFGSTGA